jgi:hypothetical protein
MGRDAASATAGITTSRRSVKHCSFRLRSVEGFEGSGLEGGSRQRPEHRLVPARSGPARCPWSLSHPLVRSRTHLQQAGGAGAAAGQGQGRSSSYLHRRALLVRPRPPPPSPPAPASLCAGPCAGPLPGTNNDPDGYFFEAIISGILPRDNLQLWFVWVLCGEACLNFRTYTAEDMEALIKASEQPAASSATHGGSRQQQPAGAAQGGDGAGAGPRRGHGLGGQRAGGAHGLPAEGLAG